MSDWAPRKLRVLIGDPISGSRPAGGVDSQSEGVPSLGGENILSDGGVTFTELKRVPRAFYDSMPRGHLQPFDVLINKDGAQTGKVGVYTGEFDEACVNEHLFILRNRDGAVDQRFLYYSLLLPETQSAIARRITGSAQPGLNSGFVDAVEIRLPSESGLQRRTAEILSTVDEAIEQTEKLIAKHQQIKAGLMHDLFSRGLTSDGHLRPPYTDAPDLYKDSPLGPIPNEWEARRLEEQIRVIDCKHYTPIYSEEGFPVIRPRNIKIDGFDLSDVEYVSRGEYRILTETHKPGRGDIVFSRNASFGIPCYVDTDLEFAIGQDVVIMTKSASNTCFVFCALCSEGVSRQIARVSGGSTFGRINLHEIRNLLIPSPQSNEQEQIAERVFSARGHLDSLEDEADKRHKQKRGLMHDLLTGEVEVLIPEADDDG